MPEAKAYVDAISKVIGRKPTARHWMAHVSIHAVKIAAKRAKSLDGLKMAKALRGVELPPEVSLMKGNIRYRAGDHKLMSNIYVGQMHPSEGDPDNLFKVESAVTGEEAAGSVESIGCTMSFPS